MERALQLERLPASIKLVALDFDLCVLRIHSFGLRLEAADVGARDMASDFVDLGLFTALMCALEARGLRIAIASFGRFEVIRAFLDRAFPAGSSPFSRDNISTPSTVGGQDGFAVAGGKNSQLEALAARFGVPANGILFFDGALCCGARPCHSSKLPHPLRGAPRAAGATLPPRQRLTRGLSFTACAPAPPADDGSNVARAIDGGFPCCVHCPDGFDADAWQRGLRIAQQACGAADAPLE